MSKLIDEKDYLTKNFIKSLVISLPKRFFVTVVLTLIFTLINLPSLREDPNALRWILLTIWIDMVAYVIGYFSGYKRAIILIRELMENTIDRSRNKQD